MTYSLTKVCCLSLLIALAVSSISYAQSEVDSLHDVLNKHPRDTIGVQALLQLANHYKLSESALALAFAHKAQMMSEELDYTRGLGVAFFTFGRIHSFSNDQQKTMEYFQKALPILEQVGEREKKAMALNWLGSFKYMSGARYEAISLYREAYEISVQSGNMLGIGIHAHNLGMVYDLLGEYDQALSFYQESLQSAVELGDSSKIGGELRIIGSIHDKLSDKSKALEYYGKSLQIFEEIGDMQEKSVVLNSIGIVYHKSGEYNEAKNYYKEALEVFKSDQITDKLKLNTKGLILNNIGDVYIRLGDGKMALEYLWRSVELQDSLQNDSGKALALVTIGEAYAALGDYQLAVKYAKEGIRLKEELKDVRNVMLSYGFLAELYQKMGDYKSAYESHIIFKKLADSLINEENIRKTTAMEAAIEFDREKELLEEEQRNEAALYEATLSKERTARNALIACFLLMAILAVVMFLNFRDKRKDNRLLLRQKAEIESQAEELKIAVARLNELDQFKESMTSMIVHDLKNPLSSILHLSSGDLSKGDASQINQIGNQMLHQVLNILDVNRFETATMPLSTSLQPLRKLVSNAVSKVMILAQQQQVSVTNNIPIDQMVELDAAVIERVFINLLINGIKYTPAEGKITISCKSSSEGKMKILIEDNGSGVPDEMINDIFNKYVQAAPKDPGEVHSTGLGLTYCKMAVEAHGGEIGIYKNNENGTTVWLELQTPGLCDAAPEEEELSHNVETLEFLDKDIKRNIVTLLDKLRSFEVYEISAVREVLKSIDALDQNGKLTRWKIEVMKSLDTFDQQLYNKLVS